MKLQKKKKNLVLVGLFKT